MFWTLLNASNSLRAGRSWQKAELQQSHKQPTQEKTPLCSEQVSSPLTAHQMGKSTKGQRFGASMEKIFLYLRCLHVSIWKIQSTGGNLSIFRHQKMTLQEGCEIVHLGESCMWCNSVKVTPHCCSETTLGPRLRGGEGDWRQKQRLRRASRNSRPFNLIVQRDLEVWGKGKCLICSAKSGRIDPATQLQYLMVPLSCLQPLGPSILQQVHFPPNKEEAC